jgi:hypothetical protein
MEPTAQCNLPAVATGIPCHPALHGANGARTDAGSFRWMYEFVKNTKNNGLFF